MATHPSLPLLACSDGYTFTVLRWHSCLDLLGTLCSLLSHARQALGLETTPTTAHSPSSSPCRAGGVNESGSSSATARHDIHEFVATITEGSQLLRNQNSSLGSLGGYFVDLEAGEIQFADSSTALDDNGGSLAPGGDNDPRRRSPGVAVPLLQAAVGTLLTCEPFAPCRGMLPSTRSLDLDGVSVFRARLQATTRLLLSTVSALVSEASRASLVATSSRRESVAVSHDFVASLLKLVPLDRLRQGQVGVALSLANALLLAFLSALVEAHCDFARLRPDQHDLHSLRAYTDLLGAELRDLCNLLEELVRTLDSTYSGSDPSLCIGGGVFKESRREEKEERGRSSSASRPPKCVEYLAPSLRVVLNLVSVLWKDVKLGKSLGHALLHHHSGHPMVAGGVAAEAGGDINPGRSWKESCHSALDALKTLHSYLLNLLSSLSLPSSNWHLPSSSRSPHKHPSRHPLPRSPPSNVGGSNGKPITSSSPSSSSATGAELRSFLDKLLRYELRAAFDAASGYIRVQDLGVDGDGSPSSPSPTLSEDRLSDILDSSVVAGGSRLVVAWVEAAGVGREVVGLLGELMAAYFTNRKLLVPLSTSSSHTAPPRHAELSRDRLGVVLRGGEVGGEGEEGGREGLLDCWNVERGVNLLLLSGKWDKACEFVVCMGDWRKAFVLAAIFALHGRELSRMRRRERKGEPVTSLTSSSVTVDRLRKLAHELARDNILRLLGAGGTYKRPAKGVCVPHEALSVTISPTCLRSCQHFLSELLRVCALTRLDSVLRDVAAHWLRELSGLCAELSTQVAPGLYLPAPPLHCPQPTITQEVNHYGFHSL